MATYYWRVDEVLAGGGGVKTGAVWSFMTHLPIDDFESYTDEEGSRIYQTWIDGYADNSSGSTVGHIDAPFAEQTIVHGGLQSMPLDYNNINSPFFSEAEREFAPAADWTVGDVNTLVLNVRGLATNKADPLYVAVKDGAGHTAIVTHPDPDCLPGDKLARMEDSAGELQRCGSEAHRHQGAVSRRRQPRCFSSGRRRNALPRRHPGDKTLIIIEIGKV